MLCYDMQLKLDSLLQEDVAEAAAIVETLRPSFHIAISNAKA